MQISITGRMAKSRMAWAGCADGGRPTIRENRGDETAIGDRPQLWEDWVTMDVTSGGRPLPVGDIDRHNTWCGAAGHEVACVKGTMRKNIYFAMTLLMRCRDCATYIYIYIYIYIYT